MPVKHIPDGYHSVTPYLVVEGAAKLIDFLKQTFDATEIHRIGPPGGPVMHAEVRIGDSIIMMGDANPQAKPTTAMIHVYVTDADDTYRRALKAGATAVREPADQFYGDRSGGVRDAFGNQWWIATHIEDVPPDEMGRRAEAAMKQSG